MRSLQAIENKQLKEQIPAFEIGDTVDVHLRLVEGEKERTQVFTGTVIGRQGAGVREVVTVRRIVQGEGVERAFPIHSPFVTDIKVRRAGKVHRAKLYYLRDRVGKATRVAAADVYGKKEDEQAEPAADAKQ